ncbi:hypothetical protein ACLOJK_012573 [Asimina triloba]
MPTCIAATNLTARIIQKFRALDAQGAQCLQKNDECVACVATTCARTTATGAVGAHHISTYTTRRECNKKRVTVQTRSRARRPPPQDDMIWSPLEIKCGRDDFMAREASDERGRAVLFYDRFIPQKTAALFSALSTDCGFFFSLPFQNMKQGNLRSYACDARPEYGI